MIVYILKGVELVIKEEYTKIIDRYMEDSKEYSKDKDMGDNDDGDGRENKVDYGIDNMVKDNEQDDQRHNKSNGKYYKESNEDGKRYVMIKDDEEKLNEHDRNVIMRRKIVEFMKKPLPKSTKPSNSFWNNVIGKYKLSLPFIKIGKRLVCDTEDQLDCLNLMGIFLFFTVLMIIVGIITILSLAIALAEIISLKSELTFLLKESEKISRSQNIFSSSLIKVSGTPLAKAGPSFLALQIIPGQLKKYPGDSCVGILRKVSSAHSGYYWIKSINGSALQVYCDMTRTCGGITGGWMRVAELDMTDKTVMCPDNLVLSSESNTLRTCVLDSSGGTCSSSFYQSDIRVGYSEVCGMIKGYQFSSPDGFRSVLNATTPTVTLTTDSNYIDGISLTHGFSPRKHIWSFAAGSCFCSDNKPEFVKNAFFCDGVPYPQCSRFCENLALWDAVGCDTQNTPWFYQKLPQTTTDYVEMRLCRDQNRDDEDVAIGAVFLYIR